MARAGSLFGAPHTLAKFYEMQSISGLVVEYIVAIDVTRARFPADAGTSWTWWPWPHPCPCVVSVAARVFDAESAP